MSPDLESLFASGLLVRPSEEQPDLVDLVRALGGLSGVKDLEISPATRQVMDLIGPAEHLVFILLDGLGMNIIRRLPKESFLCSHLSREIQATCPSTTACALTSVATADHPARHGVAGWFTYLPEHGLTMITLPFAERMTRQPLVQRGIRPEDVFPLSSICPRMTRHVLSVVPSYIANSPYNLYSRGGTRGAGYESTSDAIDQIIMHVTTAAQPTYTHLYLHDVDTLLHHVGINHESVVPLVLEIDSELKRLADALAGRARIVISADHGLINVPRDNQTLLFAGDPLLETLQVPPTGDARMPVFHVREESREVFVEQFRTRFGDRILLLETGEAERLHLFGPGQMSETSRRRFGDFIGIPFRPATLAYHAASKPVGELYLAVHAGLSPDEMEVPLVVA